MAERMGAIVDTPFFKRDVSVKLWVWEIFWFFNLLSAAAAGSVIGTVLAALLLMVPLFQNKEGS